MKYYVDKTKTKKPVFILVDITGNIKGVYESCLDAQDDIEKQEKPCAVFQFPVTKERERNKPNFL